MFNGILLEANTSMLGGSSGLFMIVYIVLIVAFLYFFMIRPQKTEQKKKNAMMSSLDVGDSVLTTAGFYGTIISVNDDTLIVEFGNNKNCRIPMQKSAVVQVEKAGAASEESDK